MADEGGEKTEEPTHKKLDDARRKGQVWQSRDLTGVAVFLVGLGTLKVMWPMVEQQTAELFRFTFDKVANPVDLERATFRAMIMAVTRVIILSVPIALAGSVVGALVSFLQVGPLFSAEVLSPKFEKLNPINGFKNMFSKKQLVEFLKSIIKMSVTGYVVYSVVRDAMGMVLGTIRVDADGVLNVLGELVYRIATRVGLVFVGFSLFDVWFQRRSYMKDMMMSKDEVKREYKESEGDPHHKMKRRELHMEILESAQMESVKGADVVVTNPEHYAIAIRYDRENDVAPRVIAKGLDKRAEAIRELARQADVPLLRNVPLAHALYRVEVGQEIPEELYDAVAEVLNFVYGLKQQQEAQQAKTAVPRTM